MIYHLPPELAGEILSKVPITSLRAVRSISKLWNSLSKEWILGKAAVRQQFLGFMTMDSKVCSFRFHLRKEEDSVDLSIKQVALLNQVEISKVFHCDGLLLCVTKENSRLVVWNPYLGQTRWIGPRTSFHRLDRYALGYDMNRNHNILRFVDDCVGKHIFEFEIYDFSSNSWRVLDVRPDWEVEFYQRGVSLKGSSYFQAHEKIGPDFFNPVEIGSGGGEDVWIDHEEVKDFLLCFDFTTERFGPRLPLPFHSVIEDTVTLSCVREEQLAVLYQKDEDYSIEILEIWVTTKIEPNAVSWSNFLKVDMRPLLTGLVGVWFNDEFGSFFIDEQEKVAVVFDVDGYRYTETPRYHTAFIIGVDGYFKSVSLGEAPNVYNGIPGESVPQIYCPPLVCSSSYLPSLVQINQPRKRKQRDDI